MKFGFESEKFLFDLKDNCTFHGVYRLVDAVSDYDSLYGDPVSDRITNEFVLNMIEMNTHPSKRQIEVIKDYLLLYQSIIDVAKREHIAPVPLASMPFNFRPKMVPKWRYYVQNSILSGRKQKEWGIDSESPLLDAANCAGLHVHFEIKGIPEFLMFSNELVNKYNMALMLTPMIAFSSSPYFYGESGCSSMRAEKYFNGVYANHLLNGCLSPVMKTSEDVLKYTYAGVDDWIRKGVNVGFTKKEMEKLTYKRGANWSMVRWNRRWNTIELRCLESDRVDLDIAKFVCATGAMRRLDNESNNLIPVMLKTNQSLDLYMLNDIFQLSGKEFNILPTAALHELTSRAIKNGLEDDIVVSYLEKLISFAQKGVDQDCSDFFYILKKALKNRENTSIKVRKKLGNRTGGIHKKYWVPIIKELIEEEREILKNLQRSNSHFYFSQKQSMNV